MMEMTREEALQRARDKRDDLDRTIYAVLHGGQSYVIAGQSITRPSLETLEKQLGEQEARIANLQGGLRRFRRVIPVDD